MSRLNPVDNLQQILSKLSEGNLGALRVLMELNSTSNAIDPDSTGIFPVLQSVDFMEIYGANIWVLYKDICEQDIVQLHAVIRAVQMGLVSKSSVYSAISRSCQLYPKVILDCVMAQLPNFGRSSFRDVLLKESSTEKG